MSLETLTRLKKNMAWGYCEIAPFYFKEAEAQTSCLRE
jgi:hypothetical protein